MDTDLVRAAQRGDEGAFATLVVAFGGRLQAVAHRILRDLAAYESKRLDPRQLPDLLPANAWADITIRPYVPSGFAACLVVEDDNPFQVGSLVLTLSEKLATLPATAAGLLRDRDAVPSDGDDRSDCLGMTTAEARQLDGALRGAGLAQDESRNRYLLEYHILLDSATPDGWRVGVWFEPILPDGTIGCSGCG